MSDPSSSPLASADDDADSIALVFDAPDPRTLSEEQRALLIRELRKRRVRFIAEEAEKEAKKTKRAKKAPKSESELASQGEESESESETR